MLNPTNILIQIFIVASGMSAEPTAENNLQLGSRPKEMVPIVRMDGYERYLPDSKFNLSIDRVA